MTEETINRPEGTAGIAQEAPLMEQVLYEIKKIIEVVDQYR